jgi:hypothetical protein
LRLSSGSGRNDLAFTPLVIHVSAADFHFLSICVADVKLPVKTVPARHLFLERRIVDDLRNYLRHSGVHCA